MRTPRRTRTILVAATIGLLAISAAVVGGRHLLTRNTTSSRAPNTQMRPVAAPSPGNQMGVAGQSESTHVAPGMLSPTHNAGPAAAPAAPSGSANLPTPIVPSGPLVVESATVSVGVHRGAIAHTLGEIGVMAHAMGGYVDSQSTSGARGGASPTSAQVAIRVAASNFESALSSLQQFGKVTDESVKSQDVTGQVANLGGEIQILQSEDSLLRGKLASATSTSSFIAIENQLTTVDQQLQGLEAQQGVLKNFAALATIDVALSIPGAGATTAKPGPANSASIALDYATHNSLVVLDALAVSIGWAAPLLVIGALGWFIVTRLRRRRRSLATRSAAFSMPSD